MIILPDDIDGLSLIEKNFDWNLVVDAEIGRGDVILHLPKFKIECTTNLKEILQNVLINLLLSCFFYSYNYVN